MIEAHHRKNKDEDIYAEKSRTLFAYATQWHFRCVEAIYAACAASHVEYECLTIDWLTDWLEFKGTFSTINLFCVLELSFSQKVDFSETAKKF